MIRAYKYVYYKLYKWNKNMWGENDMPQYNAMFGVAMLIYLNLLSIPTVIEAVTGKRLIILPELPKIFLSSIAIGFMALNYLLLVYKDKYREIVKEFNQEKEKAKRRGNFLVWSYILLSVLTLFGSWIGVYVRNN